METINNMSREELESLIRKMVSAEVKKQLSLPPEAAATGQKLVDVKELCKQFKVTRQTVNNWRRSPKTSGIINPCVCKVGGRLLFDIAALKAAFKKHPMAFGNGRDYPYSYEINTSEETKRIHRYNSIRGKLSRREELTEEDRLFYDTECRLRGDLNYLNLKKGL